MHDVKAIDFKWGHCFSPALTTVSSLTKFLLCKTLWIKIINEMIEVGADCREFLRDSAAFSAQESSKGLYV